MQADEAAPLLFQRIITKTSFQDNVDEITFASPVCLTGLAVGAMPGAAPKGSPPHLNVFARDARASGAARFACLYEGLKQPAVGVAAPFVTDHVVLRGYYQTLPFTLHGFSLAKAAADHVPRPETPSLTLEEAAPLVQQAIAQIPDPAPIIPGISYSQDAQHAVDALLQHWRKVGSSFREITASPLPAEISRAAFEAADAICAKLAAGETPFVGHIQGMDKGVSEGGPVVLPSAEDHELIDMAMGWTGLLADISGKLAAAKHVTEYGAVGLAATVLVCTRASVVSVFLARYGQLLLADALKSPTAPGSQLRHASGACLLLAQGAGALGCEALLGWWTPSFVQWKDKKAQQEQQQRKSRQKEKEPYVQKEKGREEGPESGRVGGEVGPQNGTGQDTNGKGKKKKRLSWKEKRAQEKKAEEERERDSGQGPAVPAAGQRREKDVRDSGGRREDEGRKSGAEGSRRGRGGTDSREPEGDRQRQQQRRRRGGSPIIPQVDGAFDSDDSESDLEYSMSIPQVDGASGGGGGRSNKRRKKDNDDGGGGKDRRHGKDDKGKEGASGRDKDRDREGKGGGREGRRQQQGKKQHQGRGKFNAAVGRGRQQPGSRFIDADPDDRWDGGGAGDLDNDALALDANIGGYDSGGGGEEEIRGRTRDRFSRGERDYSRDTSNYRDERERPQEREHLMEAPRKKDQRREQSRQEQPRQEDLRHELRRRREEREKAKQREKEEKERLKKEREEQKRKEEERIAKEEREREERRAKERQEERDREERREKKVVERRDKSQQQQGRGGNRGREREPQQAQQQKVLESGRDLRQGEQRRGRSPPGRADRIERDERPEEDLRQRQPLPPRRQGPLMAQQGRDSGAAQERERERPRPQQAQQPRQPQQQQKQEDFPKQKGKLKGQQQQQDQRPEKRRQESPPPSIRPVAMVRDARLDEAEKAQAQQKRVIEDPEDAKQLYLFTRYWEDKVRSYTGVYPLIAAILMDIRPKVLVALGNRLLRVLRFYERAASFSDASGELTLEYMPSKRAGLPSEKAVVMAARCGAALAGVADALRNNAGEGIDRDTSSGSSAAVSGVSSPVEPSALLFELMEARGVLAALPALLLVPATHKARGKEERDKTSDAAAAAMSNQLSLGLKPLLIALTGSLRGLKMLGGAPGVVEELLRMLRLPGALDTSLTNALSPLGNLALAVVAVDAFCSASLISSEFATAATTLGNWLSAGASQRLSALHAVCLCADKVLYRCVEATTAHCAVLQQAAGIAVTLPAERAAVDSVKEKDDDKMQVDNEEEDASSSFSRLLDALPALEVSLKILDALTKDTHEAIASKLAPSAATFLPTLSSLAQGFCGCPSPGAAPVYTTLDTVCGAFEALATLHNEGLKGVLSSLAVDLPPLKGAQGQPEEEESLQADDDSDCIGWADIREFWDNSRRRGRVESSLRVAAMCLWTPGTNSRAAAAEMHYGDGIRLVLRAVVTGTEVMEAAQADRQWVSRTGAAIDPGASAVSKKAAIDFLSAAGAAASAYFQQLRDKVSVVSTATVAALVEAHSVLVVEESSLLCMMGQSGAAADTSAVMLARRHVTSALRCWMEASEWDPPLLPLILFGPKQAQHSAQHAVHALPPRRLFTATCLLGDLSPEEWPPPGRRASNPPPSARAYRVALANAIDLNMAPVESLIGACLAAEPTLLRAAAARMLARAAGFGGGMGAFVVRPIVAALESGIASSTPAHDLRKILELLVPLVYRPAIKAALLNTNAPTALAQVLRVMISGVPAGAPPGTPPAPSDPVDAAAICTMAVECLVVICNPQQTLDPLAPPDVAALEDVPGVAQGITVASTLLEILSSLGANIPLAERVLRLMAGTPPGRAALRRAALILHAAATKETLSEEPTVPQTVVAAQWVATRYWGLSQQAQHASAPGAEAYADVADIMKEICGTLDADGSVPPPPPPLASQRFGAAAKAAITAAAAAGQDLAAAESRWDRGILAPPAVAASSQDAAGAAWDQTFGVFDAATSMFWKNFRARAVQQTPAATALVLRKYTRRTCLPDEHLTVADTLRLPLTRPLRPLTEDMGTTEESGEGGERTSEGMGGLLSPPQPQAQEQQQRSERAGDGAGAFGTGVSPGGGTTEHAMAAMPTIPVVPIVVPISSAPVLPSAAPPADFDLYADLGADFGVAPPVAPSAPQQDVPVHRSDEPAGKTAEGRVSAGQQEGTTAVASSVQSPKETIPSQPIAELEGANVPAKESSEPQTGPSSTSPPVVASDAQAAPQAPAPAPSEVPLDDLAGLLKDPSAITALLKDPARMQELLVRNPALLAVLKTRLGGGRS